MPSSSRRIPPRSNNTNINHHQDSTALSSKISQSTKLIWQEYSKSQSDYNALLAELNRVREEGQMNQERVKCLRDELKEKRAKVLQKRKELQQLKEGNSVTSDSDPKSLDEQQGTVLLHQQLERLRKLKDPFLEEANRKEASVQEELRKARADRAAFLKMMENLQKRHDSNPADRHQNISHGDGVDENASSSPLNNDSTSDTEQEPENATHQKAASSSLFSSLGRTQDQYDNDVRVFQQHGIDPGAPTQDLQEILSELEQMNHSLKVCLDTKLCQACRDEEGGHLSPSSVTDGRD